MKNKYIIISLIIFLLFISFYINIRKSSIEYRERYNKHNNQVGDEYSMFSNFPISYFLRNGEFPLMYEEIDAEYFEAYKNSKRNDNFEFHRIGFYLDWFNKDSLNYYYIPVYNRKNGIREAYYLLSAGIDGNIDNYIEDTIYTDEKIELNLYEKLDTNFNYLNYLFGKKDILVTYYNGIDDMKKNFTKDISLDSICNFHFHNEKLARNYGIMKSRVIKIKGVVHEINENNGDTQILFKIKDKYIFNEIYPSEKVETSVGDSIYLIGICHGINEDKTGVKFINCIPLQN